MPVSFVQLSHKCQALLKLNLLTHYLAMFKIPDRVWLRVRSSQQESNIQGSKPGLPDAVIVRNYSTKPEPVEIWVATKSGAPEIYGVIADGNSYRFQKLEK